MSKTLEFKVFCFEAYRAEKKLTGYETMELFKKYGVLQYLEECYDVLHTTGRDYLVEDIDLLLKHARQHRNVNKQLALHYAVLFLFHSLFKEQGYQCLRIAFIMEQGK